MIQIAILGFGVVGSGTAEVLSENCKLIEKHCGEEINVKYILDLRDFPDHPLGDRVVHDVNVILGDPEVRIVAEMMGGSHPAYEFTRDALRAGKSVVTSNKEVVATYGAELLALAREKDVSYLFEASVGGGIPIIRPLQTDLASNEILSVSGILNGTTNFILTKMRNEGSDFASVLKEAQAKGYAEANPAADVEGLDAARKIVILAALAFGTLLSPSEISVKGITDITAEDVEIAANLGCAVKLIGHTERINGKILATVAPHMVPVENPVSHVEGVFNGILVDANMLGRALFYGAGAGKLPTASAVVADIVSIASGAASATAPQWRVATREDYADPAERACRRCFVLEGCSKCAEKNRARFGYESYVVKENGCFAFLGKPMTDEEALAAVRESGLNLRKMMPVLD
ncbi:MAG: homoserine dehydrogenase [Ruminococcaceae bacterium]|nr:homoserine dehydrogenase [Oscillospiraceae bacterium]